MPLEHELREVMPCNVEGFPKSELEIRENDLEGFGKCNCLWCFLHRNARKEIVFQHMTLRKMLLECIKQLFAQASPAADTFPSLPWRLEFLFLWLWCGGIRVGLTGLIWCGIAWKRLPACRLKLRGGWWTCALLRLHC